MLIYRVPVGVEVFAVLNHPQGKAGGASTGGLPSDAGHDAGLDTFFLCGSRAQACTAELAGDAQRLE